jgi:hypothetical protein
MDTKIQYRELEVYIENVYTKIHITHVVQWILD